VLDAEKMALSLVVGDDPFDRAGAPGAGDGASESLDWFLIMQIEGAGHAVVHAVGDAVARHGVDADEIRIGIARDGGCFGGGVTRVSACARNDGVDEVLLHALAPASCDVLARCMGGCSHGGVEQQKHGEGE